MSVNYIIIKKFTFLHFENRHILLISGDNL